VGALLSNWQEKLKIHSSEKFINLYIKFRDKISKETKAKILDIFQKCLEDTLSKDGFTIDYLDIKQGRMATRDNKGEIILDFCLDFDKQTGDTRINFFLERTQELIFFIEKGKVQIVENIF